jgi:hypothetical protein
MFLISSVCALASLGSSVQFVPVDVQYVTARSLTLHEPVESPSRSEISAMIRTAGW